MDYRKIGNFIGNLRKEKNMSQKDLAKKLNVTDKAISRWETGSGCPDVSILIPLSEVLNATVNEILLGERISKDISKESADEMMKYAINKSEEKRVKQSIFFSGFMFAIYLVSAIIFSLIFIDDNSPHIISILSGIGPIIYLLVTSLPGMKKHIHKANLILFIYLMVSFIYFGWLFMPLEVLVFYWIIILFMISSWFVIASQNKKRGQQSKNNFIDLLKWAITLFILIFFIYAGILISYNYILLIIWLGLLLLIIATIIDIILKKNKFVNITFSILMSLFTLLLIYESFFDSQFSLSGEGIYPIINNIICWLLYFKILINMKNYINFK